MNPDLERLSQIQLNSRITPKQRENQINKNDLGQNGSSCKANQHTSTDAKSNAFNSEFSEH